MKTDLLEKRHYKCMNSNNKDDDKKEDYSDVLALYGCDDNPLLYMIEPRGSVKITSKDVKTTKEELENIL